MQVKTLVTAAMVMAAFATPAFAAGPVDQQQPFMGALYNILWFSFNVILPLGSLFGFGKALFSSIHRGDWGTGVLMFACALVFAAVPPMVTWMFNLDAAAIAAAKLTR